MGLQLKGFKQCWFPGAHSNIGGGYEDTGMEDITLAWMMDNLSGMLDFDPGYIEKMFNKNHKYYAEKNIKKGWGQGE